MMLPIIMTKRPYLRTTTTQATTFSMRRCYTLDSQTLQTWTSATLRLSLAPAYCADLREAAKLVRILVAIT